MRPLLGPDDRAAIEEAIRKVESTSAIEIAVAEVPTSDDYGRYRALGAVLSTLVATLVLHHSRPEISPDWLVLAELPLFAAFWLICGWRPLLMALVPDAVERAAVDGEALRIFAGHRLHDTPLETAVLILLSERERRVEILGDRAIHARVGTDGWRGLTEIVVAAIHAGRAAEGLRQVIERIGAEHGPAFPRAPGAPPGGLPNVL